MQINLHDIIEASAKQAVDMQSDNGSMPSGDNGPYSDRETPLRNTAHWAVIFSWLDFNDEYGNFQNSAVDAFEYICHDKHRPSNTTLKMRDSSEKDLCNGLIGQAWIIESLALGSRFLSCREYKDLGVDIFQLHPFVEEIGLWKRVDVNGEVTSIDPTFNHQLWFAMAGSLLNNVKIDAKVKLFLDQMSNNLFVLENNLIKHTINRSLSVSDYINSIRNSAVNKLVEKELKRKAKMLIGNMNESSLGQEIGYHPLNTYAFSVLKQNYPQHSIWESEKILRAISLLEQDWYINNILDNKYSYVFNPVGIEAAYTLQSFKELSKSRKLVDYYLNKQFELTYNRNENLMNKSVDSATLAARLYEAIRLNNYTLSIDV